MGAGRLIGSCFSDSFSARFTASGRRLSRKTISMVVPDAIEIGSLFWEPLIPNQGSYRSAIILKVNGTYGVRILNCPLAFFAVVLQHTLGSLERQRTKRALSIGRLEVSSR